MSSDSTHSKKESLAALLDYPFDAGRILRKKRAIRRALLDSANNPHKLRLALLAGSTMDEVRDILELFLRKLGFDPEFYLTGYGAHFDEVLFRSEALVDFQPDVVFVSTSVRNISLPGVADTDEQVATSFTAQKEQLSAVWDQLEKLFDCPIIQNTCELPPQRVIGNLAASDRRGNVRYVAELNQFFAQQASERSQLYLNDVHYLSSQLGHQRWFDSKLWHAYRYATSFEAVVTIAHNVAAIVAGIYGKTKKALVLDLDNTLWGGVIGEVGAEGVDLGTDSPTGEAYRNFQQYVKQLGQRGVLLSVSSKNEHDNALAGLAHPDGVLRADDFASIQANWDPKPQAIRSIATELNVGLDSLVFFDDNQAERTYVQEAVPDVAVINCGDDVTNYLSHLDHAGHFEAVRISDEDLQKSLQMRQNRERTNIAQDFSNHDAFLQSLQMEAVFYSFQPMYQARATQLINKTNQFNLTTKRMTEAEVAAVESDAQRVGSIVRLRDRIGDNGLVSAVIVRFDETTAHIDLWVMSCRVFGRSLEQTVFEQIVSMCGEHGVTALRGYYYPTERNKLVADLYPRLGFEQCADESGDDSMWSLDLTAATPTSNALITIREE